MKTFNSFADNIKYMQSQLQKQKNAIVPIIANEFLKDSNYFVPFDTGSLQKSSLINSQLSKGILIWRTPYAERIWNGYNYKFSKDSNPNATYEWAEKAKIKHANKYKKMAVNIAKQGV